MFTAQNVGWCENGDSAKKGGFSALELSLFTWEVDADQPMELARTF
jgi:hypothetical protein